MGRDKLQCLLSKLNPTLTPREIHLVLDPLDKNEKGNVEYAEFLNSLFAGEKEKKAGASPVQTQENEAAKQAAEENDEEGDSDWVDELPHGYVASEATLAQRRGAFSAA